MDCPPAIAEIVLDIIRHCALRGRSAGWAGDAARAAIEADHIHNLPDLLRCYSPDKLWYYWNAERPAYIARVTETGVGTQDLDEHWELLRSHAEAQPEPAFIKST